MKKAIILTVLLSGMAMAEPVTCCQLGKEDPTQRQAVVSAVVTGILYLPFRLALLVLGFPLTHL